MNYTEYQRKKLGQWSECELIFYVNKNKNMASNKIKKNIKTFDVNEFLGIADNERTDLSILWYQTAIENLITANVLLENKRISHCIFFMQQCIECIIKGIL